MNAELLQKLHAYIRNDVPEENCVLLNIRSAYKTPGDISDHYCDMVRHKRDVGVRLLNDCALELENCNKFCNGAPLIMSKFDRLSPKVRKQAFLAVLSLLIETRRIDWITAIRSTEIPPAMRSYDYLTRRDS